MPIHDWTRVKAGIFHDFHHLWIASIRHALNNGVLPPDYYALAEQYGGDRQLDVLTLKFEMNGAPSNATPISAGGVQLATKTPKAKYREQGEAGRYSAIAKSVVIRHVSDHRVIALVEIVSPGNKSGKARFDEFVNKAGELLAAGIHLLIVDLFPPSVRDPEGIHRAIWGDVESGFVFSPERPLTCVSYVGDPIPQAFVEPVGVGDSLPEMPVFLSTETYVSLALEPTYLAAWNEVPPYWRTVVEGN